MKLLTHGSTSSKLLVSAPFQEGRVPCGGGFPLPLGYCYNSFPLPFYSLDYPLSLLLRLAQVGTNVDSKALSGVSDEHVGRVLVRLVDVFLVAMPAGR